MAHQQEIYDVNFSPAEIAMLKEEKYFWDDKGEASVQDKNFQRFIPNLKFAFKCFAKFHGIPFALDMSQAMQCVLVVGLLLITYVPPLTTFLPHWLGR